ncbi:pirin family protein [Haloferula rosea]|uniref:Pirin family protein n=1 Tax=Haloferula rosea TaxID=490093 RepID=A0A934R9D4_9BACT|nr:pirin family protein [Haloferula rosea]MBK1825492.1 pirin family protein [Haloferula rosea]
MQTTTDLTIRRSNERGHAEHGWLDSYHSFSFANYYDPEHMGFRSLRVINEDRIAPLGGFPTHPHRDMEIFSYLVEGELAHRDSMGNERTITRGEIQVMSAGSGVTHSEFNPSPKAGTHMLQIWITPKQRGLTPRYTEWKPSGDESNAPKTLLISGDGRDNSAAIAQDAAVWKLQLGAGESTTHTLATGRGAWLQVIRGGVEINGERLEPGDALSTESPGTLEFTASADGLEALLFDLA